MEENRKKFSIKGVSASCNYYSSRIRWQVMFYPLISLLVFAISMVCNHVGVGDLGKSFIGLLQYLVIFGPLIFAFRGKNSITQPNGLSATSEATFMVFFSLIILPVLALAPCEIANQIVYHKSMFNMPEVPELKGMTIANGTLIAASLLQIIFGSAICLWVVSAARKKVILKGILFTIIANIVIGLIVGIATAVSIVKTDISSPKLHSMPVINYKMIGETLNTMFTFMIPVLAVGILVAVFFTYRGRIKAHRIEASETSASDSK